MTIDPAAIARWRDNLRDELDGVAMYKALADAERDPVRADLFRQLAGAEAEHAAVWRGKLEAAGVPASHYRPSLRVRLLARLARRFGPRFVLPTVAAAEFGDRDKYVGQPGAEALAVDERGHAEVIRQAAANSATPHGAAGPDIAKAERWHRGGSGNDLRAAVLGANDGLVSNLCLVMGVAGGGASGNAVLLTGVAGLVAGACSMALGEWLSVTNARELARTQIAKEAQELEQSPEAERRELALIYQAKGLDKADAERVATRVMSDPARALDTLAREELGINPDELGGSAWRAASVSFVLFAVGAAVPALPFVWLKDASGIAISIAASIVGLALLGVATSLFSGRGPLMSAVRQVAVGAVAAVLTYGAGRLLGVSLS